MPEKVPPPPWIDTLTINEHYKVKTILKSLKPSIWCQLLLNFLQLPVTKKNVERTWILSYCRKWLVLNIWCRGMWNSKLMQLPVKLNVEYWITNMQRRPSTRTWSRHLYWVDFSTCLFSVSFEGFEGYLHWLFAGIRIISVVLLYHLLSCGLDIESLVYKECVHCNRLVAICHTVSDCISTLCIFVQRKQEKCIRTGKLIGNWDYMIVSKTKIP